MPKDFYHTKAVPKKILTLEFRMFERLGCRATTSSTGIGRIKAALFSSSLDQAVATLFPLAAREFFCDASG